MSKSNLSNEKLTYFKDKLQSLRQEILKNEKIHDESGPNDDIHEIADYENHPADMGTEQFEQELTKGFDRKRRDHLKEIDDALDRIENGTYGVSLLSGKSIPEKRLEAEPTAKYLVEEKN